MKASSLGSELAKIRWSRIPKKDRAKHVPRNGGKKRIYVPCASPRPKDASRRHRWNPATNTCYGCGILKSEAKAKA